MNGIRTGHVPRAKSVAQTCAVEVYVNLVLQVAGGQFMTAAIGDVMPPSSGNARFRINPRHLMWLRSTIKLRTKRTLFKELLPYQDMAL